MSPDVSKAVEWAKQAVAWDHDPETRYHTDEVLPVAQALLALQEENEKLRKPECGVVDLPEDEFDSPMIAESIYLRVKAERDALQSQLAKAESILRMVADPEQINNWPHPTTNKSYWREAKAYFASKTEAGKEDSK